MCPTFLPDVHAATHATRATAWFELFMYENAAREAKKAVEDRLLALKLEALAVDVPTSRLRFKKK